MKLHERKDIGRALKLLALNKLGRGTGPDEFTLNRKDGGKSTVEISTRLTTIDNRKVALGMVNDITDRLSELIEQLLVMSRLDAGMLTIEKEPSDINLLGREAVAEAKIKSPEHIFILDLPARLPRANVDPRRIQQVLDNLIDNAVKFSDPETEIIVIARKNNPREILMTVADNGPGIPQKDQPRLFDSRFHTERKHKPWTAGAGLVLSICKWLVEAHGRRIWIESREGEGTECFFTIPIRNKRGGGGHGKKDKR